MIEHSWGLCMAVVRRAKGSQRVCRISKVGSRTSVPSLVEVGKAQALISDADAGSGSDSDF